MIMKNKINQQSSVGLAAFLGAVSLVLGVLFNDSYAAPKSVKPQSPLQVSIISTDPSVVQETIKPGDVVAFTVTVRSLADAEEMQISVSLPKGADLVAGDLSWKGAVRKEEQRSLGFIIKVPAKQGGLIKASAIIHAADGGHSFSAQAHYSLGASAKTKTGPTQTIKKTGRGGDVIEYR